MNPTHVTETTNPVPTLTQNEELGRAAGVTGGVAVGAVTGSLVGGPIGTLVGGVLGAVAGGIGGQAIADRFDSTHVDKHWASRFHTEPYYDSGLAWEDYAPAYRLGASMRARNPDGPFEDALEEMEAQYPGIAGQSRLAWDRAQLAARAAFYTDYY